MRVPPPNELLAEISGRFGLAELVEWAAERESRPRMVVVGGVVRDLLIGAPQSMDIDLVVEGSPAAVLALLDSAARPHQRFGTVTVEHGSLRIDLAEARTETYPHPGALPEVRAATVEEDLGRRDFTVNAIAIELTGERRGQLLAFPGALGDLEHRRLAVLHDRSFIDDPTRLLRLARYRGRLGFELTADTRQLAGVAVDSGALETVSGPRIGNELRLLADEPDPVAALAALSELGIDTALDPDFGLGPTDGGTATTLRRALAALPPDGRGDLLALAAASRDVPPPRLRALLDRLAFTASDRELIVEAGSRAGVIAARLAQSERASEIADAVGASAAEAIALASALASGAARQHALRWLTELRHAQTDITGDDLTAAGIAQGPAIGAGLRAARAAMLDGEAPDREHQLRVALDAARAQLG